MVNRNLVAAAMAHVEVFISSLGAVRGKFTFYLGWRAMSTVGPIRLRCACGFAKHWTYREFYACLLRHPLREASPNTNNCMTL